MSFTIMMVFFVLLCVFIFIVLRIVIPKIGAIQLVNIKLTDELSETIVCVGIALFLALFMLLHTFTEHHFLVVMSQLMTIKLITGFDHYNQWLEQSKDNKHQWKHYLLCLVFYLYKVK